MEEILFTRIDETEGTRHAQHPGYDYTRRSLVPRNAAQQALLAAYEIAPGNSNYPYHYHLCNEESFYILSGEGVLRTPRGEIAVKPGDFFFFPAGECGAHKLTNTSERELLCYLDFGVRGDADICVYPDSGKIGAFCGEIQSVFRLRDEADYYDGE